MIPLDRQTNRQTKRHFRIYISKDEPSVGKKTQKVLVRIIIGVSFNAARVVFLEISGYIQKVSFYNIEDTT